MVSISGKAASAPADGLRVFAVVLAAEDLLPRRRDDVAGYGEQDPPAFFVHASPIILILEPAY
jgi:hypothetical protein